MQKLGMLSHDWTGALRAAVQKKGRERLRGVLFPSEKTPNKSKNPKKPTPKQAPNACKAPGLGGEVAESHPGQHRLVRTGPHLQGK